MAGTLDCAYHCLHVSNFFCGRAADTEFRPAIDDRFHHFAELSKAAQSLPRAQHFGRIVVHVC